jgi:hypothetical protein
MRSFTLRIVSIFALLSMVSQASTRSQAPASAPPRGNSANTGSAVIGGQVVGADNGQPLRKTQVRIVAPDIRENRLTITDAQGRYEFKDLPAGRYTVGASKGGYVALSFGQLRPFEPGKPLDVSDGQTFERIDFKLPRGSVIAGRVLDELGDPATDVQVSAERYQMQQGVRRLASAARVATTNDLGEFRVYGLPPGPYYVVANLRAAAETDAGDRSGYAPTYYPGTGSVDDAQRVVLGIGQTVSDLSLTLVATRLARITGTAVDSEGRPLSGFIRVLHRSGALVYTPGGQIHPDGSFAIGGLVPGEYTLAAQGDHVREFASQPLVISGDDISGLRLTGAKPSKITGRIVLDPESTRAFDPAAVFVSSSPVEPDPVGGLGPGTINADLTFTVDARPGRMHVGLDAVARGGSVGWTQRAIRLAGVDVLDSGIDIKPNEDVSGLEIDLTDKVSVVAGSVTNARGEAVKDYSIVVFPRDRDMHTTLGRYFRLSRPDQTGRFKISSLPAGDYLAIALDGVDPADARDPDFPDTLRSRASSFSLAEGETKALDLKLVTQ